MSRAAKELPQELWVQILQHVPWKQRLSACALVCRKLARAAAAATQSLDLALWTSPQHHDAFLGWASNHGSSLTSLLLQSSHNHSVRRLACPNLLELQLSDCGVQLCASRKHLGLLHSCTALTSLDLLEITLLDFDGNGPAGPAPAAPARLQRFKLLGSSPSRGGTQALETRLFPHLTGLTCLDVICGTEDLLCGFPPCVSTMASLQQLNLDEAGPITATTLPGIERLTALQYLELVGCDLEPSTLQSMTMGLTRLCLESVTQQPERVQQDSALGTSQLLRLLRRCSALQKLELDSISGSWPQQLSAHSALTASSNLRELYICDCEVQGAAWAHVFPAGRQLPQLRLFSAGGYDDTSHAPFGSADIARLVSCCPALEHLVFRPAADASLAPLQSLTALTSLNIGSVSPAVISSALTAVTQLQNLDVPVSLPAAGAGGDASSGLQHLVPLTSLTRLTQLRSQLGSRACSLSSTAPAGSAPNVWVQLLEKCATDQAAQPAVISSAVRQLQQQREQVAEQADKLERQEQEHRQELAAARAEAAELRGRVQALEGQLQEVLAALRQQQQQD